MRGAAGNSRPYRDPWDWADSYREAVENVGSECFEAKTHASGNADGRMHWFLAIKGPNGEVVYVDDSFWNPTVFVHDSPPCGGDYEHWGENTLTGCGLVRDPGIK